MNFGRYDTIYLRALKSWRYGQLSLAHGTGTKIRKNWKQKPSRPSSEEIVRAKVRESSPGGRMDNRLWIREKFLDSKRLGLAHLIAAATWCWFQRGSSEVGYTLFEYPIVPFDVRCWLLNCELQRIWDSLYTLNWAYSDVSFLTVARWRWWCWHWFCRAVSFTLPVLSAVLTRWQPFNNNGLLHSVPTMHAFFSSDWHASWGQPYSTNLLC